MFINKVEFYKIMPVLQIRNCFVIQTIINEMNKQIPSPQIKNITPVISARSPRSRLNSSNAQGPGSHIF